MKTLVVARYNENLDWLDNIKDWNIIVYNKGECHPKESFKLSNLGRESGTYIHYIVSNYDNLPDYICFSQGDPFFHAPDIVQELNDFESCEDFTFFKRNGHPSCEGRPTLISNKNGGPNGFSMNIESFCNEIGIKLPDENELVFSPGAMFILTREAILRRSIEFYKSIASKLESHCPHEAYILERVWKYIFCPL